MEQKIVHLNHKLACLKSQFPCLKKCSLFLQTAVLNGNIYYFIKAGTLEKDTEGAHKIIRSNISQSNIKEYKSTWRDDDDDDDNNSRSKLSQSSPCLETRAQG